MRISDWSSDVCSSDLAWTLDLGDDEPHCRAVKVTGVGRVLTRLGPAGMAGRDPPRSEEHTSELQSLMRISSAVFCLKKTTTKPSRTLSPMNTTKYKRQTSVNSTPTE